MNPIDLAGATFATATAGVTMGTAVSVTQANAIGYCINGKAYATTGSATNAAVTSFFDPNTGIAPKGLSAGQGCIFVACHTTVGTVATMRMVQSEIVDLQANTAAYTAGAFVSNPEWPPIPDTLCPVAYFVVKVATDYTAGAKHVFGTTSVATGSMNSAATAYSVTAQNILVLPNRPQAS